MPSFVNLEAGQRTYIAHVKTAPNLTGLDLAATRADRKQLAYDAITSAETTTSKTLVPKLDALKAQGLLTNYELVAGTGALILNVPEGRSGAAFDALQGVAELGRIVRNRGVQLDDAIDQKSATVTPNVPEYNVAKVNAPAAWASGANGAGIVVGIVDTGSDVTHPDLKDHYRGTNADGTLTNDYNWFDARNGKAAPYDDHGHGTHVSGTSVGGTAADQIGVAPGAKYIVSKVFDRNGSSDTATILKGLSWMLAPTDAAGKNADATKAPDVVSNSWGNSQGTSLAYLDALKAFTAANIVPVFAAGNSGPRKSTIGSPGSYAEALTVGATDANDKVASFSSRGPSPIKDAAGNLLQKPDVSAPGVNVTSAKPGGGYQSMSGTSMATPAVAGVVAVLLSKYPTLTTDQVKDVLQKSSVDLGTPGWDADYGFGRVDVPTALAKAQELYGTTPPKG